LLEVYYVAQKKASLKAKLLFQKKEVFIPKKEAFIRNKRVFYSMKKATNRLPFVFYH